jgi:hypothetical protein
MMGTELSANKKIRAIGSVAVPVLRYSFGIINWCQELQTLDGKTKLLTIHAKHHPRAKVNHLFLQQGGTGLMQLEAAYEVEITKLVEHVDSKESPLMQTVRTHQYNINSAMLQTARCLKTDLEK